MNKKTLDKKDLIRWTKSVYVNDTHADREYLNYYYQKDIENFIKNNYSIGSDLVP